MDANILLVLGVVAVGGFLAYQASQRSAQGFALERQLEAQARAAEAQARAAESSWAGLANNIFDKIF